MEELFSLVRAVQTRLREVMTQSGVTFDDAANPLGYSNKSSIARLLVKDRMSFEDVIKIMILSKTPAITISKPFYFKVEVKATTMTQADGLINALRTSVFKPGTNERYRLPDGLTWEHVAEKTGFDSSKSARKSWFLLQTPLYLVIGMLKLLNLKEHIVETENKATLRICL